MQIKVQNFIKKRMFYLFFDQKYKKKRHFPKESASKCICLTDYRTFIDNLKAFAEFIQWYKLYRL